MSYYYNYYLGYQDKNGKIYPLGPFDCFGKIRAVVSNSRSFASDLHDDFNHMQEDSITDELKKVFGYTDFNGVERCEVKWLPIDELPSGSFIKEGYFLMDDIMTYKKEHYADDLFYDYIPAELYAAKLQAEIVLGPPKQPEHKDDETDDYDELSPVHSCRDYAFYAYPDYRSREYEAHVIREAASDFMYMHELKDATIVVLETEG